MGAPKGNKFAIGNNGGRPPTFKSAKELAVLADEYFEYIKGICREVEEEIPVKVGRSMQMQKVKTKVWDRLPEPATVSGLALYLGFSCRQSLYEYQEKKEFADTIKRAKARVEMEYEKTAHATGSPGAIFALKNMGWADKHEIQQTNVNYNTELTSKEIKELSKQLDKEV